MWKTVYTFIAFIRIKGKQQLDATNQMHLIKWSWAHVSNSVKAKVLADKGLGRPGVKEEKHQ